MKRWILIALPLSLTGVWLACSSNGASSADTSSSSSGSSGACPEVEPKDGDACVAPKTGTFSCTYGQDPRPCSRRYWACDGSFHPQGGGTCTEPQGGCPANLMAGDACSTQGASCAAGDTICDCAGCMNCADAGPLTWKCQPPPTKPGCPPSLGNQGAACDGMILGCSYGITCIDDVTATCDNGVWSWNSPCDG